MIMKYGIFIISAKKCAKEIHNEKSSSPVSFICPVQRSENRSIKLDGIDNPGYTMMTQSGKKTSEIVLDEWDDRPIPRLKHKDSIVSTASFEKESFMIFLGRQNSISKKSRTFSLQDIFEPEGKPYKAYLYNRFGNNYEIDQIALRNGSGIHHIYNGSVIVTDVLGSNLRMYSASGRLNKVIPIKQGAEPWTTAATPSGTLAVALSREKCVSVLSCTGEEITRFGQHVLECPNGIIVDRRNRFIVTDARQNKIHIFSQKGILIRSIPEDDEKDIQLNSPRHVTLSHQGNIIVSDSANHCIRIFDRHGDHVTTFGKYGSGDGELKFPHGVCTNHEDNIIVADYYNNRVSLFSNEGEFIQHLVTAHMGLKRPQAVTIRHHQSSFILFITYGDMKANTIVAYKIIDSKNEQGIENSAHAAV